MIQYMTQGDLNHESHGLKGPVGFEREWHFCPSSLLRLLAWHLPSEGRGCFLLFSPSFPWQALCASELLLISSCRWPPFGNNSKCITGPGRRGFIQLAFAGEAVLPLSHSHWVVTGLHIRNGSKCVTGEDRRGLTPSAFAVKAAIGSGSKRVASKVRPLLPSLPRLPPLHTFWKGLRRPQRLTLCPPPLQGSMTCIGGRECGGAGGWSSLLSPSRMIGT